jgi:hypothetical protein
MLALAKHDVRIHVSVATGVTGAELAASIIIPRTASQKSVVAVGFPGGGYSRG